MKKNQFYKFLLFSVVWFSLGEVTSKAATWSDIFGSMNQQATSGTLKPLNLFRINSQCDQLLLNQLPAVTLKLAQASALAEYQQQTVLVESLHVFANRLQQSLFNCKQREDDFEFASIDPNMTQAQKNNYKAKLVESYRLLSNDFNRIDVIRFQISSVPLRNFDTLVIKRSQSALSALSAQSSTMQSSVLFTNRLKDVVSDAAQLSVRCRVIEIGGGDLTNCLSKITDFYNLKMNQLSDAIMVFANGFKDLDSELKEQERMKSLKLEDAVALGRKGDILKAELDNLKLQGQQLQQQDAALKNQMQTIGQQGEQLRASDQSLRAQLVQVSQSGPVIDQNISAVYNRIMSLYQALNQLNSMEQDLMGRVVPLKSTAQNLASYLNGCQQNYNYFISIWNNGGYPWNTRVWALQNAQRWGAEITSVSIRTQVLSAQIQGLDGAIANVRAQKQNHTAALTQHQRDYQNMLNYRAQIPSILQSLQNQLAQNQQRGQGLASQAQQVSSQLEALKLKGDALKALADSKKSELDAIPSAMNTLNERIQALDGQIQFTRAKIIGSGVIKDETLPLDKFRSISDRVDSLYYDLAAVM